MRKYCLYFLIVALAASLVCGFTGARFTAGSAVGDVVFSFGNVRIDAALPDAALPDAGQTAAVSGVYQNDVAWTLTNTGSLPSSIRVIPEFLYTVGDNTSPQGINTIKGTGEDGAFVVPGWICRVEDYDADGSDDYVFYYDEPLSLGSSVTLVLPFSFEYGIVDEISRLEVTGIVQSIQTAYSNETNGWTWSNTQIEENAP